MRLPRLAHLGRHMPMDNLYLLPPLVLHRAIHEYPQITVYHPKDKGHPFANIGWTGWIGSIAGMYMYVPYLRVARNRFTTIGHYHRIGIIEIPGLDHRNSRIGITGFYR